MQDLRINHLGEVANQIISGNRVATFGCRVKEMKHTMVSWYLIRESNAGVGMVSGQARSGSATARRSELKMCFGSSVAQPSNSRTPQRRVLSRLGIPSSRCRNAASLIHTDERVQTQETKDIAKEKSIQSLQQSPPIVR